MLYTQSFLFNFQHWEFCLFKGPWNMNSTIIISIVISKDLTSPWRPKIVKPLQATCSTELCNFLFLLKIPATWQTGLPSTRDISLHSGYASLCRVLYQQSYEQCFVEEWNRHSAYSPADFPGTNLSILPSRRSHFKREYVLAKKKKCKWLFCQLDHFLNAYGGLHI